jgi:hypothetical protein
MCEGDACHGCRIALNEPTRFPRLETYPTLRFGTGPVKGHCPKASAESKVDQLVTPRRVEGAARKSCRVSRYRSGQRGPLANGRASKSYPAISATDGLLYPELVHSDERIRIVSLKTRPVAQISAKRIVRKACAILMKHLGINLEADEMQS